MHPDLSTAEQQALMQAVDRVPEDQRSEFLKQFKQVYARLAEICKDHPRTIGFGALGWLVGELVDSLLTVSVPFYEEVCLTGDMASSVGGCVGAVIGCLQDRERIADRDKVNSSVIATLKHFRESST